MIMLAPTDLSLQSLVLAIILQLLSLFEFVVKFANFIACASLQSICDYGCTSSYVMAGKAFVQQHTHWTTQFVGLSLVFSSIARKTPGQPIRLGPSLVCITVSYPCRKDEMTLQCIRNEDKTMPSAHLFPSTPNEYAKHGRNVEFFP